MRLAGKVAVITGASSGNGREIALRFAQDGADLVLPDRYFNGADGVCSLLQVYGRCCFATETDISVKAEVEAMVERTVREMGRIDILVASANVKAGAPFLELAEHDWNRSIDVNLTGTFLTCQAVARQMVAQGTGGCIITIASVLAERGFADAAAYAASKAGVQALTRTMAVALAPYEIRVNAIAPSFTDVDIMPVLGVPVPRMVEERTPLERLGLPGDIASAASFLASADAGFITGTTLTVDGGFSAGFYSAQLVRAQQTAAAERAAGLAPTPGPPSHPLRAASRERGD